MSAKGDHFAIYELSSHRDEKYIGMSGKPAARRATHLRQLYNGEHCNQRLQCVYDRDKGRYGHKNVLNFQVIYIGIDNYESPYRVEGFFINKIIDAKRLNKKTPPAVSVPMYPYQHVTDELISIINYLITCHSRDYIADLFDCSAFVIDCIANNTLSAEAKVDMTDPYKLADLLDKYPAACNLSEKIRLSANEFINRCRTLMEAEREARNLYSKLGTVEEQRKLWQRYNDGIEAGNILRELGRRNMLQRKPDSVSPLAFSKFYNLGLLYPLIDMDIPNLGLLPDEFLNHWRTKMIRARKPSLIRNRRTLQK